MIRYLSLFVSNIYLGFAILFTISCSQERQETQVHYSISSNGSLNGQKTVSILDELGHKGSAKRTIKVHSHWLQFIEAPQTFTMKTEYILDSISADLLYMANQIGQSSNLREAQFIVEENTVKVQVPGRPDLHIQIPPDAWFENTIYYPFLVHAFTEPEIDRITHQVFIPQSLNFDTIEYELISLDSIHLVVIERNLDNGTLKKKWINLQTALLDSIIWEYRIERSVSAPIRLEQLEHADLREVFYFPLPYNSPGLQNPAEMRIELQGRLLNQVPKEHDLTTLNQSFTGSINSPRITGTFKTSRIVYSDLPDATFPLDKNALSRVPDKFMEPDENIQSTNPAIVAAAARYTKGVNSLQEAVHELGVNVQARITNDEVTVSSAMDAWKTRSGDCSGQSMLLAALLRASGIPARLSSGVTLVQRRGTFLAQHVWVEYYNQEIGWVPFDVALNQFDEFSAQHIKLGQRANCMIEWTSTP